MFGEKRSALTQTQTIIIVVVLLLALVAGGYFATLPASKNAPREIDIIIVEDNPVLQLDHFYPDTVVVPLGENITIAVSNQDDETRVFTLSQFNMNLTMPAGTAGRYTFTASSIGNFSYISPKTPPSAVSAGRPGPCLEGFFEVTQNATLLSTSTSTTSVNGTIITACLTSP